MLGGGVFEVKSKKKTPRLNPVTYNNSSRPNKIARHLLMPSSTSVYMSLVAVTLLLLLLKLLYFMPYSVIDI